MLFKFIQNDLKPFLITLVRYLKIRSAAALRWVMRGPLHLAGTLVVVFALLIGAHVGSQAFKGDSHHHLPTAEKTQDDKGLNYRKVEAKSADQPSQGASPQPSSTGTATLGTSAQAVKPNAPSPSYTAQSIPDPIKPKVDTSSQESVAKGFAQAYLSRKGGNDQWKDWTGELTNSDLKDFLSDAKTPLRGRGSSAVTKTKISDKPFDGAPADTKIRWSRTLTTTVQTEKGGTLRIDYQITMMRGEKGWQLTDAVEDGWQAVTDNKKG